MARPRPEIGPDELDRPFDGWRPAAVELLRSKIRGRKGKGDAVAQLLVPASGPVQLGKSVELAFSAAELGPVQHDPRRTPGIDRGVVFLRDYLAHGSRPWREIARAGLQAGLFGRRGGFGLCPCRIHRIGRGRAINRELSAVVMPPANPPA